MIKRIDWVKEKVEELRTLKDEIIEEMGSCEIDDYLKEFYLKLKDKFEPKGIDFSDMEEPWEGCCDLEDCCEECSDLYNCEDFMYTINDAVTDSYIKTNDIELMRLIGNYISACTKKHATETKTTNVKRKR